MIEATFTYKGGYSFTVDLSKYHSLYVAERIARCMAIKRDYVFTGITEYNNQLEA